MSTGVTADLADVAANFRRDMRATGLLEDTGSQRSEGPGRPGRLYRRV